MNAEATREAYVSPFRTTHNIRGSMGATPPDGEVEVEMGPPGSLVLTPALTPAKHFRCRRFLGWSLIPYMIRDHGLWAVWDSNPGPWD